MVYKVVIEPGHGRDANGFYDPGVSYGMLKEERIANEISRCIEETLCRLGVRTLFIDFAIRQDAPHLLSENMLHIRVHCDSHERVNQRGVVYYNSAPGADEVAAKVAEAITAWGSRTTDRYGGCFAFGMHPDLCVGTDHCELYISPFDLKALDAIIYAQRLTELGRLIGYSLAKWAIQKNPGVISHCPLTAQWGGEPPPAQGLENFLGPCERRDSAEQPQQSAGARDASE